MSQSSEYAELRDRLKGGDLAVDFQRLRISYVGSPEAATAGDTSGQRREMIQAVNAGDFKQAGAHAERVLEGNYSDLDAHYVVSVACRELGDARRAQFHRAVFNELLNSILKSGDGKSMQTAYVVASIPEEYVVLRVLGLQPDRQALVEDKGHSYDFLQATDPKTGQTVELYFNVDVSMNRLRHEFEGGS